MRIANALMRTSGKSALMCRYWFYVWRIEKMNEELLNCPFCGGEAEFSADTSGHQNNSRTIIFHIRCKECKIVYPKRYEIRFHLGSHGEIVTDVDERKNALEAWNKRTCSCKKQEG